MPSRSRTRSTIVLSAGLVAMIAACHDTTAPDGAIHPAFAAGDSRGGQFEDFTPLSASAACVTPPSTEAGFASYQPFVLPQGYSQTILATELRDFRPVAGSGADLPDMIVANETGPEAGRYLYRTHEVGSNGAVTVTDLVTGQTSLVDQQPHYEALDGIVWTPWHTLLFAEERIVA